MLLFLSASNISCHRSLLKQRQLRCGSVKFEMPTCKESLYFLIGLLFSFCTFSLLLNIFLVKVNDFPIKSDEIFLSNDGNHYNEALASDMFDKVKIICIVMTHPDNHQKKAIHVKNTWGKRCNKLLFMSSAPDAVLETVVLDVNDTREHLWIKTVKSFQYVHRYHLDEADWFLKADDDK